ncbi:C-5 cytosine-specific DNA methylase [Burkholderia pseudomallei]|uniref:DNA cytosine methyltransferase n=1 Tax=Burkholderia pseudomallei TaxID=28450 RepID=UPI0005DC9544|nr:DNA cytosine methyltransferase [Burkholderia pseudomallei]CAK1314705.1 C-5 cytosine-specific DNA methylase [Burkholderia pseudomallei]
MNTLALRYGSVCSGIEAVSVAWQPLGLEPAWFAEIDPFANAVLDHHYPDVPNLGDMTGIAPRIRAGTVAPPDILVGGTPCQSFSVAGRRQGLADPRGALTLHYVELAHAIDQVRLARHQPASILVWENVPGVLSDRHNAFGCFLGALAGETRALEPPGTRWTHAGCVDGPKRRIAWRVLDAQYFGLAQRRKRVFVVASARDDFDPATVLFEFDGVCRHPAPRGETPQGLARGVAIGPHGSGFTEVSPTLDTGSGDGPVRQQLAAGVLTTLCYGGGNTQDDIDRAACLTARGHKCDFEVETFAVQAFTGHVTHTLNTANGGKGCGEDGTGRGVPIIVQTAMAFAQNSRGELRMENGDGRIAGALSTGGGKPGQGQPAVLSVALRGRDAGATAEIGGETTHALRASTGGSDKAHVLLPALTAHLRYDANGRSAYGDVIWRVRRLMPIECERLQGFPDQYTLVPYRGKSAADAPRYRAIGNSMAVPCVRWIGERLLRALNADDR